jgi:hypothetical protein
LRLLVQLLLYLVQIIYFFLIDQTLTCKARVVGRTEVADNVFALFLDVAYSLHHIGDIIDPPFLYVESGGRVIQINCEPGLCFEQFNEFSSQDREGIFLFGLIV